MTGDGDGFKLRQRQLWSIGDEGALAAQYQAPAEQLVAVLDLAPGERVLDIATGTGNAAIAAARRGARVTGLDITPELFDLAEARAVELGVTVEWDEGDAEALPYPDASFDVAVSSFGVMFAPHPHVAAAELVRVLRPGGRFALCNWSLRGVVWEVVRALSGESSLPSGEAHPLPWGEPGRVAGFFAGLDVELAFTTGHVPWLFADADDGVRWLEEVSGAVIAAKFTLEARGEWASLRARLVEAVGRLTRPDMDGVWVDAEYLVTTGRRLPAT